MTSSRQLLVLGWADDGGWDNTRQVESGMDEEWTEKDRQVECP